MSSLEARGSQSATEDYSAKKEIDQFMRRFLGFVKEDNDRVIAKTKSLGDVGSLSAEQLISALHKLDRIHERLDVEYIKSVEMQIQIEALSAVRRNASLPDMANNSMSADTVLRRRCDNLQNRLDIISLIYPVKTISKSKAQRVSISRRRVKTLRVKK